MMVRPILDKHRLLLALIVVASISLRVCLCIVNRQANDDHWLVVSLMLRSDRAPDVLDCHQCYHPKLFYWTAYYWLRALGITAKVPGLLAIQALNGIVGLLTLAVVWRFLGGLRLSAGARIAAFGLFALNPAIITVNAQVSNDTFSIFFSTCVIHCTARALKVRARGNLFLYGLTSILANASKLTALQVTLPCAAVLCVGSLRTRRPLAALVAILVLFSASAAGPLAESRERFGSAVTFNFGDEPPIFENWREFNRTGGSVVAELLWHYASFRFFSLIDDPAQGLHAGALDDSLWTQVYARANSIRFASWPREYITGSSVSIAIRKAIYLLALSPLSLSILGLFLESRRISLSRRTCAPLESDALLVLAVVLSSLGFAVVFTFVYYWPHKAVYKAIYLFPASLAYLWLYGRGLQALRAHDSLRTTALVCAGLLMIMYAADVSTLALDLGRRHFGAH